MPEEVSQKMLGDHIVNVIRTGQVKMRPRWYFALRDILGVLSIVMLLLIVVYLASFIIFVLHEDGAWFVPVFGLAGWYALFNALPWMLIFLSTLFIVTLAVLAKRYPFGYQWPLIYSIFGIGFLVAGTCFLFVQSSLYASLFNSALSREIPLLGWYYPGIGFLGPNDIHRGTYLASSVEGFTMQDVRSQVLSVVVASATILSSTNSLNPGDAVVVFGSASPTGTVLAAGVERIKP